MINFFNKILKIKAIKVILCVIENIIKSISIKFRQKIEDKLHNPYDFGEDNIEHTRKLYKKLLEIAKKHKFKIKDQKLLELGPGGFLGLGAFLKKEGLVEYNILDNINHFEKIDKKTIQLYKNIDKDVLNGDKFDTKYVKQLEYKNNKLPLENNSIDIVFSNAVYEHIKQPGDSIKEISRITRKGGISIHTIDFRDHIFNQNKLNFLKIPNRLFNFLFSMSGAWVNRKRYSDFVNYFQESGFEVVETIVDRRSNERELQKYKKLLRKYPREDILNLAATFICKKK